jgi:hypothetical protein
MPSLVLNPVSCGEPVLTCCAPSNGPMPQLRGDVYYYLCGPCGDRQLDYKDAGSYNFPIGDPPSYTITQTWNVSSDECKYYKVYSEIRDYTVIPDFPDIICHDIFTYEELPSGECRANFSIGPQDLDCIGRPGNARNGTFTWTELVEDCDYRFAPPIYPINGGIDATEFKSRFGETKDKSTTILKTITHQPTVTCYLKVWVRALVQNYQLVPRAYETWTPPTEPPPFTENPNCVAKPSALDDEPEEGAPQSVPDWEENSCYRAIIEGFGDIFPDPVCCDEKWDKFCEDRYQACLGKPAEWQGPCNGPFDPVGLPYAAGQVYTYEWDGGNLPCVSSGPIVGAINWLFETEELDGPGKGRSMDLEIKWTAVRNYEPPWPSE